MNKVSFVVDANYLHYYQAELLLFSLDYFGKHAKKDILIHCVNGVDESFINWLHHNGYSHKIIEPFLDKKYCNKLVQLESFNNMQEETGGVFLMDTDTFVLEPLSVNNPAKFNAKNTDAPNPPNSVIENIYNNAGLSFPPLTPTDFQMREGVTPVTNFNGGFYYTPFNYVHSLSNAWKKWASWLFDKKHLFDNPHQAIHIDQVSMGLALEELEIPFEALPANFNYPIHEEYNLTSFNPDRPVSLIHYHRSINRFGIISGEKIINHPAVLTAVNKANHAIANNLTISFLEKYKRSQLRQPKNTDNTERLRAALIELKAIHNYPLKLIIHGGAPKTGTTSLQYLLYDNNEEMQKNNICYPDNADVDKRHQWIVSCLLNNDVTLFIEKLTYAISKFSANVHTIILSTEGLFNHWFDFNEEALSLLQVLAQSIDTEFLVWLREPFEFTDKYYKQCLINPRVQGLPYGTDISLDELCKNEWYIKHLDYLGFLYEAETIFGKEKVFPFKYDSDTITTFFKHLNIENPFPLTKRENLGLSNTSIGILRSINQFPLSQEEKSECLLHIKHIDKIISKYSKQDFLSEGTYQEIKQLTALEMNILKNTYNIHFH